MRRPSPVTLAFSTVLLCLGASACNGDDDAGGGGGELPNPGTWRQVGPPGPGGALLSIWGRSATDVYTVGGDPGWGTGPSDMHLDRGAWVPVPTEGASGATWWVHGPGEGIVYMVGAGGTILRHDSVAGTTTTEEPEGGFPEGEVTLFGVWGAAADDVWAVGGVDSIVGLVLHRDASGWSIVEDTPEGALDGIVVFKVFGCGPNDLWFVGTESTLLRKDASGWRVMGLDPESELPVRLLTVHSDCAGRVVAVGGAGESVIAEFDGDVFRDVSPPNLGMVSGVFVGPNLRGDGVAVGDQGLVVWSRNGRWSPEFDWAPTDGGDLHAVWVDPTGEVWAVGGNLLDNTRTGVLVHYGEQSPPLLYRSR